MGDNLLRTIKGMHDVVPAAHVPWFRRSAHWEHVLGCFRELARAAGYRLIMTPTLEFVELFRRGAGESSDIVKKEMYALQRGDDVMVLRPEGSAPVARAVAQHRLASPGQILKVFYTAEMFRAERPQKGRYRQHTQLGMEVFGSEGPLVDAEVMVLLHRFYQRVGLTSYRFLINSLGSPAARARYREVLRSALAPALGELCRDCQERYEQNPMRILDCKVPRCRELTADAPLLRDSLDDEDRAHYAQLKEMLTALGVPFEEAPRLVRGLDYYSRTCFEVACDTLPGAIKIIGGGGRYDGLVEQVGGKPTPAVGFGTGVERVMLALESQKVELPDPVAPEVFLIASGDRAVEVLELATALRTEGIRVSLDYKGSGIRRQLKRAGQEGARYALFLKEAGLELKDLQSGAQESVERDALVSTLRGR